jgi:hypothetical protein
MYSTHYNVVKKKKINLIKKLVTIRKYNLIMLIMQ